MKLSFVLAKERVLIVFQKYILQKMLINTLLIAL